MNNSAAQPAQSASGTSYFSPAEWIFFVGLLIVGILLRFFELDVRPVHHDESLHGMYGRYFFDFPEQNYYKYNPMLHGPFLYNFLRFIYNTFGSSTWAVRLPMAVIGSGFMFLPFLFRRYLQPTTVLCLTAAISLSPTLVYYSRFIREDLPSLCSMLCILIGCSLAPAKRRPLWVCIGLSAMFCIKENSFVTLAILLGYLIFEFGVRRFCFAERDSAIQIIARAAWRYRLATIIGLSLAIFLYCWLYSAGFRYSKGILDGLYRESIVYWLHHHTIERIKGPFLFHAYVFSWYEFPFVLAFFTHLYLFYRRAPMVYRLIAGAVVFASIGLMVRLSGQNLEGVYPWQYAKLKDSFDVVGFLVFLVHPFLVVVKHLADRNHILAFWGYFFTANLFTYSYLGEKVPWLSLYPLTAGLIYFALFFEDELRQRPIVSWRSLSVERSLHYLGFVLGCLTLVFIAEEGLKPNLLWLTASCIVLVIAFSNQWSGILGSYNLRTVALTIFCLYSLRASILTNFTYAGHAREFLSQVHTTPEFDRLIKRIRDRIENSTTATRPRILGTGEVVWPLTWYLVDIPEYRFSANAEERATMDYILQDWAEPATDLPPGFVGTKMALRGWWVPDYSKMTLKNFLNYTLNHEPWGDTGFTYVTFAVRGTP